MELKDSKELQRRLVDAQERKFDKWGLLWNDDDWLGFVKQELAFVKQVGREEAFNAGVECIRALEIEGAEAEAQMEEVSPHKNDFSALLGKSSALSCAIALFKSKLPYPPNYAD